MARSVVGNRATIGSDHRPIVGQSLRPTTDRTINRGVVGLIARSIVASGDGSRDQSWHHATDHTINHGVLRPTIVASTTDRTLGRTTCRKVMRQIGTSLE